MAELREPKPVVLSPAGAKVHQEEEDKPKTRSQQPQIGVDLSPDLSVVLTLLLASFAVFGTYIYYRLDNVSNGPFASYINEHHPFIPGVYSSKTARPLFGAAAQEVPTPGELILTDAELAAYTGEDTGKPIYLAINGTIFDVSASPAFYGPGGHYHHFVGKDATRAWVTECWDSPDQLTWDMDGIEAMFTPRYMDEDIENAANEDFKAPGLDIIPVDMKQKLYEKVGRVSKKERAKRREEDEVEAAEAAEKALGHWVQFFAGNAKYKAVGTVDVSGRVKVEPPEICEEALKKRPLKGGKLDALMKAQQSLKDIGGNKKGEKGAAAGVGGAGEMPDFVKEIVAKKKKEEGEAKAAAENAEETVEEVVLGDEHEEL